MPTITKDEKGGPRVVQAKTRAENRDKPAQGYKWWLAKDDKELSEQLLSTVTFLKMNQEYRYRQAGVFARLYGNQPLFNAAGMGSNISKNSQARDLPIDRPTMNVVQSCVDTLVSRITQSRPKPVFLTDNGDYRERTFAKQMNTFINGELYQTKAYEAGELLLRDAAVLSTGCQKVYESADNKVALDRVLLTELLVDPNDAIYGNPRQLFHIKLVDKSVLAEIYPDAKKQISNAEQAFPDQGADSSQTISDQIIVAEGWHLPSGKEAGDGRHSIVCSAGVIADEVYEKTYFPFNFLHYSPRLTGFWGQGLTEQLMGTQAEINRLLITISQSINLVGVPRVFVEMGSKVNPASLTNGVGAIVKYSGVKPSYEVAPSIAQDVYAHLERLKEYAYQQSGISSLSATSQKPAGLNSGEAIRSYDDLQSDRFAALARRYQNSYINLSYLITDKAADIAKRDGKYSTVYPNKNGTKQVDLPKVSKLGDTYVIQCFDESALPRDPAGRLAKVTEMMQGGLISIREGRRMLDYPDIDQVEKLANSGEERILQYLDDIVEDGKYSGPDPFMDLELATELCTQYYNLYVAAKLEESKAQMLRTFFDQIQTLKQEAMAPPPGAPGLPVGPGAPGLPPGGNAPTGVPQAPPVSDLLPTAPQAA